MTLSAVTHGKANGPTFIVVYGPEGIGKSTLIAGSRRYGPGMPKPIWIGAVKEVARLNVSKFPEPQTWTDVLDALRALGTQPHDYKTVVLDPIGNIETLIHRHICARDGKANLKEYGWNDGAKAALEEWKELVRILDKLADHRGMSAVLIGHEDPRVFKNPDGSDYHRHQMSVDPLAAALLRRRACAVLFVTRDVIVDKVDGRGKAIACGEPVVYTKWTATHDAKNRFNLPESMPLKWADIQQAIDADDGENESADPSLDRIQELMLLLSPEEQASISSWLATNPAADKLQEKLNRIEAQIKERS